MNIYDIAKACNVSIATVSRTINSPEKVKQATRDKIVAYMKQHHFSMSSFAQILAGNGSLKLIGVICTDFSNAYFSAAVFHLHKLFSQIGYEIILSSSGYTPKERDNAIRNCIDRHVDALILIGSVFAEDKEHIIQNSAENTPVFLINGHIDHPNIFCTCLNDYKAVFDVVSAFEKTTSSWFLYRYESYSNQLKRKAYSDACEANGLSSRLVKLVKETHEGTEELVAECIDLFSQEVPNVILTDADNIAFIALQAAKALKINVPDQMKILGYNNSLLAQYTSPALSSIDSQIIKLSEITFKKVQSYFKHETPVKFEQIDTEVVHRETF